MFRQKIQLKIYPAVSSDMSVSERLSQCVFSLPMHPYLEETTQDYIIDSLRNYLEK
ncbi:MAG: hypothetical protein ACLFR0_06110 [Alphaproteobacteria bacterium]